MEPDETVQPVGLLPSSLAISCVKSDVPKLKQNIEPRRRTTLLERTWELETLFDLTTLLAEGLESGALSQDSFPDSRSRMDIVIDWANEFNQLHAWTDWDHVEYLETVRAWFDSKTATVECFEFTARGCGDAKKKLES